MNQPTAEEREISLGDLIAIIWQRKWVVVVITVLSGFVGLLATWLPAPVYEAQSVLLFPAGGVSPLIGIAQSLGISVPSGGTAPLKMYRTVLESERIRRLLSEQVNLTPRQLQRMTTVREDPQASSISITVRHTDPQLAQQVARLYISALATLNREMNLPLARNQVEFLEKELAQRTRQLRQAENQLLQFQRRMVEEGGAPSAAGIGVGGAGSSLSGTESAYLQQLNSARLQLEQVQQQIRRVREAAQRAAQSATELPADLPPAAEWRKKLADLEYELRVTEITYGPDAPEVVRLKKQIGLTQQQLRTAIEDYLRAVNLGVESNLAPLELQRVGLEAQIAALQQLAARAPADTLRLQRLAREVATLGEIVKQLRVALEQARLEMSRDPNRWEVLEEGTLKERPVNKRWVRNTAVALSVGLMLGAATAVAQTRGRRTRTS
ncbi:MAG: Wzz/FepE/Etk N-terminal domain-containing protein [Armatimonadota bacterium]|nr:Wzz/FepE/Etk N-terminal domain-containing protein [Armatimonadota bacterium]